MGGHSGGRAALAAALLAAALACSPTSADKAGPTATVRTEPAPVITTTTPTTNPYAVPPVIDIAYVNRVLAGLDAAEGDIVRLVFRAKTVPPEALERLKALYATPDARQLYLDGLQVDLRTGFKNYRGGDGNKSSVVTRLLTVRPDCIFAEVHRDYSAVTTNTLAIVNPQWVGLRRYDGAQADHQYNPTPWAIVYDGFPEDRSQPKDPCAR